MSIVRQLLLVVALVFGALVAWTQLAPVGAPSLFGTEARQGGGSGDARRAGRGARQNGGIRVTTAEVGEAEAGARLAAIGTARAARSVTLYSQTAGIVSEISFSPGDAVRTGDVLVRLDDAEQRIAVEQARIAVETAQDTVDRSERLAQSQSIAAVQLREAHAELARARTELAAAELALDRRRITAPFDGVVGFPEVEIGDMLSSTIALANIDDRGTLHVEFTVPERFSAMVSRGTGISATTAAYPGERFEGEVAAIDSRVDATSRALRIRAAIPNPDDRLRPGMSFQVALSFDTPGHPAVPEVAVQWDRDGAFVWKVVDGRSVRTPVRVIARTGGRVLVDGDIRPADLVVAEGLETLREGAEVAEVPAASADPAPL